MKAIYISEGDYASNNFENAFGGILVSDIIKNPSLFTLEEHGGKYVPNDEYEYWKLSVMEVGETSPEFLNFVRKNIQDYDDSKHRNFWMENEVVGQ